MHFANWAAEGEIRQIPWAIRVGPAELRPDQRLGVHVQVRIKGKDLNKRGPRHDLFLLAQAADGQGAWIAPRVMLTKQLDKPLGRGAEVQFWLDLLVLPGDYSLVVGLFDRATNEHNLTRVPLRVAPLRDDPLPLAFRNLPQLEFLGPTEGLEDDFRPELASRLWLPVETRRPVHVEVVVNFSPSEQYIGLRRISRSNVSVMLAALETLSQLEILNGTLALTGLDLLRQQVVFEQNDVHQVDWPRLRQGIEKMDASTVSVHELTRRKSNAAFFRKFLAGRLAGTRPPARADGSSANGRDHSAERPADPLQVFLIVSNAVLFAPGADLSPLPSAGGCGCRVYYLRYELFRDNMWDDLNKLMRPLEPRRLFVRSPRDFRNALARILAELREL